jgi:hypothetical protein
MFDYHPTVRRERGQPQKIWKDQLQWNRPEHLNLSADDVVYY